MSSSLQRSSRARSRTVRRSGSCMHEVLRQTARVPPESLACRQTASCAMIGSNSRRTHVCTHWSCSSPRQDARRSARERHLSSRQLVLTAVREGSGQLVLREIEDRDLDVLFEHWTDRDAIRMAAFTSPDQNDRTNFERRWARLRSDSSTTNRVIEIDGRVVGHIASFDLEGHREVTYWIGREDWGRGIATRALQEFLQLEATRPLYARRCERQRRVDSCVDEVRFPARGRGARVRSWAQRGNGRGRPPTRCMTPTALD